MFFIQPSLIYIIVNSDKLPKPSCYLMNGLVVINGQKRFNVCWWYLRDEADNTAEYSLSRLMTVTQNSRYISQFVFNQSINHSTLDL